MGNTTAENPVHSKLIVCVFLFFFMYPKIIKGGVYGLLLRIQSILKLEVCAIGIWQLLQQQSSSEYKSECL